MTEIKYGMVSGDPVFAPADFPNGPAPAPSDVGFLDAISGPAWRVDNVVANLMRGDISSPEGTPASQRVDVWGEIQGTRYEDRFDSFAALNSRTEVEQMKERLDREDSDRQLLQEAGVGGFAATLVASALDLPSLIPGGVAVGAIRGGATAARVGARTAIAAGAEATAVEGFLQSVQETRTAEESAGAIGGSVILGGLIGTGIGAVLARTPGGPEAFKKASKALETGVDVPAGIPGDLSAAARIRPEITDFDLPTKSAQFLKDNTPTGLSFTDRFAGSQSPVARQIGSELLQNSYAFAGVERLQMQPAVDTFASVVEDKARVQIGRVFKDDYKAYKKNPGGAPLLTHREYSDRIAQAMRRGDEDPEYPAVTEAARKLRDQVVEPLKDQAIKMGLLPENVTPETAVSYFSRMWDANRIIARSDEFLRRTEEHFAGGLRSGVYRQQDVAQQKLSGLENELRNLADENLDTNPEATQFLRGESAMAGRAAELRRETGRLGKRPFTREVIGDRGIDPASPAADELRSLGVTAKNSPGLFRKGGLKDVDNLPADDFAELADVVGVDRGFLSRQGVLDALADEARGTRRAGIRDQELLDELADLDELLAIGRSKINKADREGMARIKELRDRIRKAEETARSVAIKADFTDDEIRVFAREAAEDVFKTLSRTDVSPTELLNVTIKTRGPLNERTFNVKDVDFEDFLINDAEEVLTRYARVMAAETELTRRFGSPDMKDQIAEVHADFDRLRDEATTEKARIEVQKERNRVIKSLKAARDQVRGTYMQKERASGTYRTMQGFQSFNYIRALGDVVASSLTDVFKLPMVHGMGNVIGDGVVPLLRSAGVAKAAKREISEAAGIAEVLLNNRMMRIADITDPLATRTPVEKFTSAMSSKASLFSGILHWNQFLKEMSGQVFTARLRRINLDSPVQRDARLMQRLKLTKTNLAKIQKQMRLHGQDVEGVFVPNIEDWDPDAARLFGAVVRADTETVIVTPDIGDKVPLAEDKWFLKPALQFKQFALASHRKTLITGLQEDQARFMSNAALMVSMGMFVYWLKAQSQEKDRLSDNPGVWLAEGIDRSGIVPVVMEVNNMFERIGGPGVYYGLGSALGDSPQRASRFQVRSTAGAVLGPTFGLLTDATQVAAAGLSGDIKKGDIGSARRLVPFGNHPGIKQYLNLWLVPDLKEAVE